MVPINIPHYFRQVSVHFGPVLLQTAGPGVKSPCASPRYVYRASLASKAAVPKFVSIENDWHPSSCRGGNVVMMSRILPTGRFVKAGAAVAAGVTPGERIRLSTRGQVA